MLDSLSMFFADFGTGTFLHWLLAAGVTLLVLDIFFSTEVLSWLSIAVFATWGTWLVGLPVQWSVLVFIAFVAVGMGIYYTLWVRIIRPAFLHYCTRGAPLGDLEALVGRVAVVRGAGDAMCAKIQDEFWPIEEKSRVGLQEGDSVTVTAFKDGFVTVKRN